MRTGCSGIKKILLAASAAALVFASACSQAEPLPTIAVSITDSIFFSPSVASGRVEAGRDFTTVLDMLPGYEFVSCDYDGEYASSVDSDGNVTLTLRNVTAPARVTVLSQEVYRQSEREVINCSITYDYNGGTVAGQDAQSETRQYTLTEHIRPNTWNGQELERGGYTLLGWNTSAEGDGQHIGLGSRVTVPDGQSITLYAEWVQWLPEDDFLYRALPDGTAALTGYRGSGDADIFVIPAELDGRAVTEIASSFTTNIPCGAISSPVLVLPDTVVSLKSGAFGNSAFSEIYFFDNLESVSDTAFPNNISTYHLNAALPPHYQAVNNSAYYADNVDRLIVNADKKKLVFFAGCSFAYGVNSNMADNMFGGEYVVCNMGVNGDINGAFQMEIILSCLGEGDILVHSPEQMSAPQLMSSFYLDGRMFIMIEGNYDLLSIPDFSDNDLIFRAYMHYAEIRGREEPCSYSDGRTESFNEYGDFTYPRPYDEATENQRDVTYSDDKYNFAPEMLTEEGVAKLAGYYAAAEDAGAKVYITYAPVNSSAQTAVSVEEAGESFGARFKQLLAPYGYAPISDYRDYIYSGRYFYDSDYHLNDYGAIMRTVQLIKDLQAAGV